MFAIMGATGNTGRAVARHLAKTGAPFRALTRQASHQVPGAAEICIAQPQDADSLTAAFTGATAVYAMIPPFLTSPDVLAEGRRTAQAIATAVRRAGVGRVVALSSGGAHLTHATGLIASLRDLEAALGDSGARITRLRAADFMENWTGGAFAAQGSGILPSGRFPFDAPMETVSVQDVGRIAADCLLAGDSAPDILNLLGPQDYTVHEVVQTLETLLQRKVTPLAQSSEQVLDDLLAAGIGPDYAQGLIEIYDGLNTGRIGFEPGSPAPSRGTVTIEAALAAVLAA